MKKKNIPLYVILLSLVSPMFSFAASWELYDDFNSGTLDAQKWNNTSTVSTITIENERIKIIHLAGNPEKSGYLNLTQDSGNILGIKATITIDSCTGDVRTRIAGHGGEIGENHIWSAIQLQPGQSRIYSSSYLEGPPPEYIYIKDTHYGAFKQPLELLGNTYDATMIFSSDRITYEVEGLGKIDYKYATDVAITTGSWKVIGTRSTNGDGPCTVYIDDVYVLRP